MTEAADSSESPAMPTRWEALRVWIKIGLLSFGGPTGQIALMHRELVERRRWVSDGRFVHALNYCMALPGPEAQQLAIYIGWLLHRVRGGLMAGICFVLPGAILIWGIALIYVRFGSVPWLDAFFQGLKPAVVAIVAAAMWRLGRKVLRHPILWALAAGAFVAIRFGNAPFPAIILMAAGVGWLGGRFFPRAFPGVLGHEGPSHEGKDETAVSDAVSERIAPPSWRSTAITVSIWAGVWWLPVALAWMALGGGHVLTQEGLFFSKAALVTFGGAYAVLPYVAQQAVETHGWLSPTQMMDGLALAETTPGPLILVLQFVGFLGGWNEPGILAPWVMATLGAWMTSWVTFVPGFLFIFAGGPYVERSRGNRHLDAALSAVTAAVVGVVLNLGVWFGWHVVFPEPTGVDWLALALVPAFFFLLQWRRWDVLQIIALAGALGLLLHLLNP